MTNTIDLCGLEDVKQLMQKSGQGAGAQDALIAVEITRASEKIMVDYAREFVPGGAFGIPAVNATRTFEVENHLWVNGAEAFLDLSPYDLQITPVPTVVMDPDLASSITITSDQFRLWPVPPSKGVYEAIRLSLLSASGGYPRFNHRQVAITGNWGFPSVPHAVVQACAATVIHWLTNYPAARRPMDVDSAQTTYTPRSYPMSAVDDLKAYCRPVV